MLKKFYGPVETDQEPSPPDSLTYTRRLFNTLAQIQMEITGSRSHRANLLFVAELLPWRTAARTAACPQAWPSRRERSAPRYHPRRTPLPALSRPRRSQG